MVSTSADKEREVLPIILLSISVCVPKKRGQLIRKTIYHFTIDIYCHYLLRPFLFVRGIHINIQILHFY
jgi:hypothetical protein